MRRSGLLITCLVLLASFLLSSPVFADKTTENLMSFVIDSFDNPEDREAAEWNSSEWIVRGSKFSTKVYDEDGNVVDQWPKSTYLEAWPEAFFGANKEERDLKVLGVNGRFDRQGYNYIELIPAVENDEGELEPRHPDMMDEYGNVILGNEITLPGRTKIIDMWVWGSNYDFYFEIHLRDFKGIVHVLNMGNLKFTGWKNLRVNIPSSIPQEGGYVTSGGYLKELKLVKMVLWTRPNERVADFFYYFDHMKTLSDMFVSRFDGDELADTDRIQEIWNTGEGK
jgi:hypothetical protein